MQHLMSRLMLGCAVYALLAPPAIAAANKPLAEKESAGANASASNVYAIEAQSAQSSQPVSQSEQRVVEDSIVTATRNETRLQETPLAITAHSGSSLRERQITEDRKSAAEGKRVSVRVYLGRRRIIKKKK